MGERRGIAHLTGNRRRLAERITERHFREHPELDARHGAAGREKCRQDAEFHLEFLEQAVALSSPELFADYVAWAESMLASRGIARDDLDRHLRGMLEVLRDELPADQMAAVEALVAPHLGAERPAATHAAAANPHALDFLEAVRRGGPVAGKAVIDRLPASEGGLRDIYVEVIQPALQEIGRLWQVNRISVADEHFLTAAIQVVLAQFYPQLFARPASRATVVVACVSGELHQIGARMVADILQLDGFDTHFLGASTPVGDLVDFVAARKAPVLGLSASTALHLSRIEAAIDAVRGDPRTRTVRILVGGRPFVGVPGLWRAVGADAFAADARSATETVDVLARR